MDCMWIWRFEWIASGYGYGYDGDRDVDTDLDMVMRCSKKLQYILAWGQMMPNTSRGSCQVEVDLGLDRLDAVLNHAQDTK